jgi:type II secretory pathway pseudopilin PulG
MTKSSSFAAFTLVELAAVTSILVVLVSLCIYGYGPALNKVQSSICISQMKSIHMALSTSFNEKGFWPQPPEDLESQNLESWWINDLASYQIKPEKWICPTIKKYLNSKNSIADIKSSYAVSNFDNAPSSPYKWAMQPWLIEVAGMHSLGPHICFPDGSIQNMNNLIKNSK